MAEKITNNMYLINAPAGSGKTTYIRNELKRICTNEPDSKVLCITYTNRAAEELSKDLNSPNITVSTIHSYVNHLISPFYSSQEALNLYWDIFSDQIRARIINHADDEHISQSNKYYIEQHGGLSDEIVRVNLKKLSYGETPFTSLYSGKLSHDDLLIFSHALIHKYPVLQRKISSKYAYIFIDEYQDTSAYILDIFYEAVKGKNNVKLYLLGDRMQQIYHNYDGSFEERFGEFNTNLQLNKNHRSVSAIVSILNKIYNDSSLEQEVSDENKLLSPDIDPQIILSSNIENSITHIQTRFADILILYLMNQEKYKEIGAETLYHSYSKMDTYSFGRKYSSTDVLSNMTSDNPDNLMRFLFLLYNVMQLYISENYGRLISLCKNSTKYFKTDLFKIQKHCEKKKLREKIDAVRAIYDDDKSSIRNLIDCLYKNGFISETTFTAFGENPEYIEVLDIQLKELKNLADYLSVPHISTQHGVKGESHTSVVFVAADNYSTPNVRMYSFFKLWSRIDFSLPEFEQFYYSYVKKTLEVENALGMKTSQLTAETHNKSERNRTILARHSTDALAEHQGNQIFDLLCKDAFSAYLSKPNVSNAKKIFKISDIEGILTAYKLFYVGCSRARKNLLVIVDKKKIADFQDAFSQKAKQVGFNINDTDSTI